MIALQRLKYCIGLCHGVVSEHDLKVRSEPWVYRFAFKCQYTKSTFVDAT